ncbi:replication initiation protein (plasmid) [Klebsiella pneumoniae]
MPAFEWVHVQLHQQKGMISLSPPTICNSANQFTTYSLRDCGSLRNPRTIRLYESLAQFKSSGLWVTTHAWLNDRFLLPESQQKNLAELKRSFLDPALKQINEKTPLLAKYSIDDSGKFLFSIIDKQNPV